MLQIPPKKWAEAVALIKRGGTLVFPSETSYGLGCDATNQKAVDKIYRLKNRPSNQSLLIIVPDIQTAKKYLVWNDSINLLAKKFWRRKKLPLTIVGAYAGGDLASGVVSNIDTLAVRVTHDRRLKKLCRKAGRPLVATSANASGAGDIYDDKEVIKQFSQSAIAPDAVIMAGVLTKNPPSTIVDATAHKIKILRQGALNIRFCHPRVGGDPGGGSSINSAQLDSRFRGNDTAVPRLFTFTIAALAALAAIIIGYFWQTTLTSMNMDSLFTSAYEGADYPAVSRHDLQTVKGLYLTAYSSGSSKKINEIIDLIDSTELNAVVIDIKDYSGLVLYDSNLALVNEMETEDDRLGNVAALVQKLHDHNIYVIARQTVFQDPVLAEAKPEWAIRSKTGGVWRDTKGLSWVDPTRTEVWDYNVAIAKEAADFGFDEINFDYVRFPSDGKMNDVIYTVGNKEKYEVMGEFYEYLSAQLQNKPIWLSLDMFGLVMETNGTNDMNIGQRLDDAVAYADYICPMMYPSHYPAGQLGYINPADYPAEIISHGLEKGLPKFESQRAKVRPWIQAFDLGAVYDAGKIRAEIDAVEKYTDAGWLLWNASNRYTKAGLK